MKTDAWLDLCFLHLVGVGKREATKHVNTFTLNGNITRCHCAITLQFSKEVVHLNLLVFTFSHLGSNTANWQFTTFYLTHPSSTRFGDIKLEVSLASNLAQVWHIHRLTQLERVGASSTENILVQFV